MQKLSKNIQWIWKNITQIKFNFALTLVLLCSETLASIASVGLQQRMIDDVFINKQMEQFNEILLLLCASYLMYALLFTLGPLSLHRSVVKLKKRYSKLLMNRMYHMPVDTLQKERVASFVYSFTNDLQQGSLFVGGIIPRIVQELVTAITLIVIISYINIWLFLILLLFSFVYFLLGRYFGKHSKELELDVNKNKSNLLVTLEEGVASTREVIAFNRIKWEEDKYNHIFQKYYNSVLKKTKWLNRQILCSDPVKWGATIIILFVGGWMVLQETLSVGMFIVIFQFSSRLMDAFHNIFSMFMKASSEIAIIERLRNLLEGRRISIGNIRFNEPIYNLCLDRVSFSYSKGDKMILENVSIDIPVGKKIALVGSSGGGKSTITNLLTKFYSPLTGEIRVNHHNLKDINQEDWSNNLSVVFQDPYLFPDTIKNNIVMGLEDVDDNRIIEACKLVRIHDFICSLPNGFDSIVGERGIMLSGGQRQRISLARALVKDTELLILDESTSSLDLETERQVQEGIDKVRKGKTTIIIAHRLSTIQNADLIYVLDKGRVTSMGTHNELIKTSNVYRELVYTKTKTKMKVRN